MVAAVDRVADIVHISRDPAQLTGAGIISELFEDVPGDIGGQSHMRVAMVGEPEHPQCVIARFDQGAYVGIVADIVIGNHTGGLPFSLNQVLRSLRARSASRFISRRAASSRLS